MISRTSKELVELLTVGRGRSRGAKSLTAEALGTLRKLFEKFLYWCDFFFFWSIETIHFTIPFPLSGPPNPVFSLGENPPES